MKVNDKNAPHILYECSISKLVNSPNVVNCEEVFEFKDKLWVFLELLEEGDLSKLPRGYDEDFCRYTIQQVARGLQALHAQNILHRDIKAENILHRKNGDVKLADMGLSVFLTTQEQLRASVKGSTAFFSPEIA